MKRIWNLDQFCGNKAVIDEFGNELSYDQLKSESDELAKVVGEGIGLAFCRGVTTENVELPIQGHRERIGKVRIRVQSVVSSIWTKSHGRQIAQFGGFQAGFHLLHG